jgi:hypothetical protein
MIGYGKDIELEKDGKKVLWARIQGKDPVIQLANSEYHARIATTDKDTPYSQWHQALGPYLEIRRAE